jgi:hypothetical protein
MMIDTGGGSSFLPAENSGSTLRLILHDAKSPSCFSITKVEAPIYLGIAYKNLATYST